MKVLITGGAGYVGTELLTALCQENEIKEIIVYDNFSGTNCGLFTQGGLINKDKIKIVEGDILDSRKLNTVVNEVNAVIHLAAKVSTPYISENHHDYDQVNHWGTAEVVYAIEESPNVEKFIHLSSAAVYGFTDLEVDEASEVNPSMAYGVSKFRAESHVKRLLNNADRQVLILRSGNVFGFSPSMRFESVINRFAFNAKYLRKIVVYGLGDQMRPFIEVSDLVRVIKHGLLNHMSSKIYNVFDDNMTIIDIANIFQEIFPELEKQYLNQHVSYGSLRLKQNHKIEKILTRKILFKERILDLVGSLL